MPIPTKEQIFEALKPVQDPEIKIGIVDLGLIYDAEIADSGKVSVKMTFTTPACPFADMLLEQAYMAVGKVEGVTQVEILLVWEPQWDPKTMASDQAKDILGIW